MMFKFAFYDGDKKSVTDDGSAADSTVVRLRLQEHVIPGQPSPVHENELVSLSLCGHHMKFLNGDLVVERLKKQGLAGDLACASECHSDLIPDVYEGGMKLWECARDLVTFLDTAGPPLAGRHVLELGCGAALPAVFCLLRGAEAATVQDYNREVVDHLTIPNLHLNVPERQLACCRAFSGDWGALAPRLRAEPGRQADLVVTSETIYSRESWPRLLEAIDAGMAEEGMALVAAKTFYFGVGGGTRAFEQAVLEDGRFTSVVVFATKEGLHREILRLKRT